jgi:hypothetical protein
MRRSVGALVAAASLLFQLIGISPTSATNLPTFDPTSASTKGIYFDGGDNSYIQAAADTKFDIGGGDFTIDWWQKASKNQLNYPRLFQFGDGSLNSDGFAVSEEGGRLYFWLDNRPAGNRGPSRVSVELPDTPNTWNHFAIVRKEFVIAIYVNGTIGAVFDARDPNPEIPHSALSDMFAPTDNGTQPLIIGGSNASNLGGFKGEVTAFEILKGAKWDGNFTPPVDYTAELCQRRDASNVCDLEALLLLYPAEDFVAAAAGLTNRVDDVELSVNAGVSYGENLPSYTHVSLIKSGNGYVSLGNYEGTTQDTLGWSQQVDIDKGVSPYIYIYPNDGFEFASVTLTLIDSNRAPIDGTSVHSTSDTASIAMEDLNAEVFWFTWDDGSLQIPANFTDFEAEITFQPILTSITLMPSENGQACIEGLGLESDPCSGSIQSVIKFDPVYFSPEIRFLEDLGFDFESVTVRIGTGQGVTVTTSRDSLTVLDSDGAPWIFDWYFGALVPPDGVPNFEITTAFVPQPPNIQGASFISGEVIFNSDDPIQVNSNDPSVSNDYSDIESIVLEIPYFGQDPENPSNTNKKFFCRALIEDWAVTNDPDLGAGANIDIWLPILQTFSQNCPGYKQTNDKTIGNLFFFEYIEGFDYQTVSRNLKVHDVDIQIDSPPGIRSNLTTGDTTFGDDIVLEISHLANSDSVYYQIFSNRFSSGFCTQNINLRDAYQVLLPEKFDENGNLLFHIPSIDQINTSCSQSFIDGHSAVESSLTNIVKILLVDKSFNFESYIDLDLAGAPNSIDNSSPAPQITPTVILPTVEESTASDKEELKQPLIESPIKQANKLPVADTSWCTKKGIWIYTVSGKLRVCDPTQKVAVQMKACSGKAATPTYPWIFKPQRFIPGATPTKSGKVLMNAVFFYKGLAISGSEKVSDKPCSNGSVFIPVEYSKMVFNFAKSERPLIWVKAS